MQMRLDVLNMKIGCFILVLVSLTCTSLAAHSFVTSTPSQSLSAIEQAMESGSDEQRRQSDPLQESCKPGTDNRSSDLCAQWKAADAAAEAAAWARPSFIISTISLISGALTLLAAGFAAWFAGRAAKETQRAAVASEAAVALSEKYGQLQTRAYVSATRFHAKFRGPDAELIVEIKNTGQTPAYKFTLFLLIDDRKHDNRFVFLQYLEHTSGADEIGGGEALRFRFRLFPEAGRHELTIDQGMNYYYSFEIILKYEDIFGAIQERRLGFIGSETPAAWGENHELFQEG